MSYLLSHPEWLLILIPLGASMLLAGALWLGDLREAQRDKARALQRLPKLSSGQPMVHHGYPSAPLYGSPRAASRSNEPAVFKVPLVSTSSLLHKTLVAPSEPIKYLHWSPPIRSLYDNN
jgi:hypothetical protein